MKVLKSIRENPKIFPKSEKKFFKIQKNISNHNVFLEIIIEDFIRSQKLLQILIKLDSTNIILQILNKFASPRVAAKTRKQTYAVHTMSFYIEPFF